MQTRTHTPWQDEPAGFGVLCANKILEALTASRPVLLCRALGFVQLQRPVRRKRQAAPSSTAQANLRMHRVSPQPCSRALPQPCSASSSRAQESPDNRASRHRIGVAPCSPAAEAWFSMKLQPGLQDSRPGQQHTHAAKETTPSPFQAWHVPPPCDNPLP